MRLFILTMTALFSQLLVRSQNNIPDAEVQAITQINKQYGEAFLKNDSALFLDCYASDACIMAPDAPLDATSFSLQ
jgi:hypothetical protein